MAYREHTSRFNGDGNGSLSAVTIKIINDIKSGQLLAPSWFNNNIQWVESGAISENDFLTAYHNLIDQNIIHSPITEFIPTITPTVTEIKKTWWVTKPSGDIVQVSMTDSSKAKAESIGWIFTTTKPFIPEPIITQPEIIETVEKLDPALRNFPKEYLSLVPSGFTGSTRIKSVIIDYNADYGIIIDSIDKGKIIVPSWFKQFHVSWIKSGHITSPEFLAAYSKLVDLNLVEQLKEKWWVVKPSGQIEEVTVTQEFVNRMTEQGWKFSKFKPVIEEPENQNISVVFYVGTGGDLKTHFGINSIIVTPDEAEKLGGWLHQNYNTKILLVMNRLTNDIRTHTLQQVQDLVIQKLKDDEPTSGDITKEDIKKPPTMGFLGAGFAGAIGLLILGGFLGDFKK